MTHEIDMTDHDSIKALLRHHSLLSLRMNKPMVWFSSSGDRHSFWDVVIFTLILAVPEAQRRDSTSQLESKE